MFFKAGAADAGAGNVVAELAAIPSFLFFPSGTNTHVVYVLLVWFAGCGCDDRDEMEMLVVWDSF